MDTDRASRNARLALCRSAATGERFRLPTEAEWEYTCRAGTTTPFHWGDQLGTDRANYDADPPVEGFRPGLDRATTLPVASFPPNAWGLHDMHGNVWEFCEDRHDSYALPMRPGDGERVVPRHRNRVIRGGSFAQPASFTRSAGRYGLAEDMRLDSAGIRPARALDP